MAEFAQYGYAGLFAASFLAATVLPFSSEIIFGLMIGAGFDFTGCLVVATIGNWLGGMSSYYLGYLGKWECIEKWLKVSRAKTEQIKTKIDRYGSYTALFCWLPFIGDPIAVALGFVRSNALKVALFMLIGKFVRYLVLGYSIVKGKESFL